MDNNEIIQNAMTYINNIISILTKRYVKENYNSNKLNYKRNFSIQKSIILNTIVENNTKLKLEFMKIIIPILVNDVILKITNLTINEFITDINKTIIAKNKQITDVNTFQKININTINDMEDIIYYAHTKATIKNALTQPLMYWIIWNKTDNAIRYSQWNNKIKSLLIEKLFENQFIL